MENPAKALKQGELVRDTKLDRIGEVQALLAGRVYLRPPGGGVEWEAHPDQLELMDSRDQLHFRARKLNHASSKGQL